MCRTQVLGLELQNRVAELLDIDDAVGGILEFLLGVREDAAIAEGALVDRGIVMAAHAGSEARGIHERTLGVGREAADVDGSVGAQNHRAWRNDGVVVVGVRRRFC